MSKSLQFTKMHGLGNDFIIINAIHQMVNLSALDIPALACRQTGVGFDQCLVVESSSDPDIDFFYRIFNANGQEVGQCGNGARCLARFVQKYQLTTQSIIQVATLTTQLTLYLNDDQSVTVNMGYPHWMPDEIPLNASPVENSYQLPLAEDQTHTIHALSIGNPHAVTRVDNIKEAPVLTLGRAISEHPLFPEQANASFMEIVHSDRIKLRVYERGCGETQACGSGAVAAAAVARRFFGLNETIHVELPGGELIVNWKTPDSPLLLTGPATFVYEGVLLS